jgi:hypothetical protein
MQMLNHPNVVFLKHCFYTTTEKDELYLNLVLEYVPQTIYQVSKTYYQDNHLMPLIYVKLYTYQVRKCVLFHISNYYEYFFFMFLAECGNMSSIDFADVPGTGLYT